MPLPNELSPYPEIISIELESLVSLPCSETEFSVSGEDRAAACAEVGGESWRRVEGEFIGCIGWEWGVRWLDELAGVVGGTEGSGADDSLSRKQDSSQIAWRCYF